MPTHIMALCVPHMQIYILIPIFLIVFESLLALKDFEGSLLGNFIGISKTINLN